MIIDTHAHLDYSDYNPDRVDVLARAAAAGVTEIISIGTSLDSSARALELASSFEQVWTTVGIHPTEADSIADPNAASWIEHLRAMAMSPRVVAIGEIGLDYHRLPSLKAEPRLEEDVPLDSLDALLPEKEIADRSYKDLQEKIFRRQLDLAVELGLNVVIHQRDSMEDILRILEDYRGKVRGVFHCFIGDETEARTLLDWGHLISFTGIVTFKNALQVQATAKALPLEAFMLETDCPYLAPTPYRGKRCEPAHTATIGQFIAQLREVELAEIAEATTRTARNFFAMNRSAASRL